MKIVIEIPDNYNLDDIKNGSIACGQILKAVKNGTPYNPSGDLISREALKKAMEQADMEAIDYEMLAGMYEHLVRNAPTVSDRYDEGYAQGYVDGSTGADWKGEEQ